MKESELWDRLHQKAKNDAWYQTCLEEVNRAEAAYLTIREILNKTQKDQLDDYIAACEALEDSLIFLAFELGKTETEI